MPEPVMTDKDVVALVRKEFERKVANYCKERGIEQDKAADEAGSPDDSKEKDSEMGKRSPPSGEKPEILDINALRKSIGLRVIHKDSGLEYYIRGVNTGTSIVDLEAPEGNLFQVDFGEIENDYKLG
jgi:hypothetical protein